MFPATPGLDKGQQVVYNRIAGRIRSNYIVLIKSGGGNGPVKPGNLCLLVSASERAVLSFPLAEFIPSRRDAKGARFPPHGGEEKELL